MNELKKLVENDLYFSSHTGKSPMGDLLITYAFAQCTDANLFVCIGSGEGTVPKILREAQLKMNKTNSKTILVDAVTEAFKYNGVLNEEKIKDLDFEFIKEFSNKAYSKFEDNSIDILYLDHHHSLEDTIKDIELYLPKMSINSYIFVHDVFNSNINCTVNKLYLYLDKDRFEFIRIPVGEGILIISPHIIRS
jgi:hypothetical protein